LVREAYVVWNLWYGRLRLNNTYTHYESPKKKWASEDTLMFSQPLPKLRAYLKNGFL
jgi:hypothetical protein